MNFVPILSGLTVRHELTKFRKCLLGRLQVAGCRFGIVWHHLTEDPAGGSEGISGPEYLPQPGDTLVHLRLLLLRHNKSVLHLHALHFGPKGRMAEMQELSKPAVGGMLTKLAAKCRQGER